MEDKTKFTEALKSVWSSLTNEQKAKAAACKTAKDYMKLAGEECNAITRGRLGVGRHAGIQG